MIKVAKPFNGMNTIEMKGDHCLLITTKHGDITIHTSEEATKVNASPDVWKGMVLKGKKRDERFNPVEATIGRRWG